MLAFVRIAPRRCGSAFKVKVRNGSESSRSSAWGGAGVRGAMLLGVPRELRALHLTAPRALRPGLPRSTPGSLVTSRRAPLIAFNQSSLRKEIIRDEGLPFCFGSPSRAVWRVAGTKVARRQRGRFPTGAIPRCDRCHAHQNALCCWFEARRAAAAC